MQFNQLAVQSALMKTLKCTSYFNSHQFMAFGVERNSAQAKVTKFTSNSNIFIYIEVILAKISLNQLLLAHVYLYKYRNIIEHFKYLSLPLCALIDEKRWQV